MRIHIPMRSMMLPIALFAFVVGLCFMIPNKTHAFKLDPQSLKSFIHSSATVPFSNVLKSFGKQIFTATSTAPEDQSRSSPPENSSDNTKIDIEIDPSLIISIIKKAWTLCVLVVTKLGLTIDDVVNFLMNGFMWVLQQALRITDSLLSAALGK